MNMRYSIFSIALLTALLFSCNNNKKESEEGLFDYSEPVDLSYILKAYDQQKNGGDDDIDKKLFPDMPEDGLNLFEDTSFVLHVPEYADSKQPFLANAEDFYNSCCLTWNIYSNFEVWFRGHSAFLLYEDDVVKQSIENISVDIIHDQEVRQAAQLFKDSTLMLMATTPDEWEEDVSIIGYAVNFGDVIESKAYRFYDDEEAFVSSLDSVTAIAEGMAKDRFQRYLDASEKEQLGVILGELAACSNFDEQCSLWYSWANCNKSDLEDDWITGVAVALMKSGKYSPILHRIWIAWRSVFQLLYFGASRDSDIPNVYYNEYRKMCYVNCLKRIEAHPEDIYAMNCAAAIAGRTNINRFGMNYFGNESMIEKYMMLPNRISSDEGNDEEDDEEE